MAFAADMIALAICEIGSIAERRIAMLVDPNEAMPPSNRRALKSFVEAGKDLGIEVEPIHVALWGIPTAISAFAIHALRLHRLDRQLAREIAAEKKAAQGEQA